LRKEKKRKRGCSKQENKEGIKHMNQGRNKRSQIRIRERGRRNFN
jgi:hypothetical protein